MNKNKFKKIICVFPGIGTPISIYYFLTSRELRSAAIMGILLLPSSAVIIALSIALPIPSPIILLAGAYLYWGVISLLAGAGFLTLLLARFFTMRAQEVEIKKEKARVELPSRS